MLEDDGWQPARIAPLQPDHLMSEYQKAKWNRHIGTIIRIQSKEFVGDATGLICSGPFHIVHPDDCDKIEAEGMVVICVHAVLTD